MAEVIFNQSGGELRMQDGGAYKVSHIGKQPVTGLTVFHGDTNHARVFAKMSRNFEIHVTNFDK